MATVASKVLARIAAFRKEPSTSDHTAQKQFLLHQNLKHSYSRDEEILVDQDLPLHPNLNLAPFNTIQANALQIAEIHQQYLLGLQHNSYRQ